MKLILTVLIAGILLVAFFSFFTTEEKVLSTGNQEKLRTRDNRTLSGDNRNGIKETSEMSDNNKKEKRDAATDGSQADMQVSVTSKGGVIVFKLNNSSAAKNLFAQLPLSVTVENYSDNEKIFHPTHKLATDNTPLAKNVKAGTLAYFAPWDNVVMFYGPFGSYPGLYELGQAVSGKEHISGISGKVQIAANEH